MLGIKPIVRPSGYSWVIPGDGNPVPIKVFRKEEEEEDGERGKLGRHSSIHE